MLLGLIRPPARRCSSPLSFKANSQGRAPSPIQRQWPLQSDRRLLPRSQQACGQRGRLLQTDGHAGETKRHLKADLWSLHPEDDALLILQRCSLPTDDECGASACRAIGASDV
jgi:hypothetical protein